MIALVVFTDGRREYIERTLESVRENIDTTFITRRLINDDSGDPAYRAWLEEQFSPSGYELVGPFGPRLGFGGAIRHAWDHVRDIAEPFVFHLEDDFTFNRPVNLVDMAAVLIAKPHLVQLALRRQAWNAEEIAAGGVIESHPHDFAQVVNDDGHRWLEHRRFWTTNASLYRRSLTKSGWPDGDHSEGAFTHQLLATSPSIRFAYWGSRDDGPWVHHIGDHRAGEGY